MAVTKQEERFTLAQGSEISVCGHLALSLWAYGNIVHHGCSHPRVTNKLRNWKGGRFLKKSLMLSNSCLSLSDGKSPNTVKHTQALLFHCKTQK